MLIVSNLIYAVWFFQLVVSAGKHKGSSYHESHGSHGHDEYTPYRISKIETITHDTNLYRFEVPNNRSLHFPVTSHIKARKTGSGGEKVKRSYTPVSDENQRGYFDLIIKIYPNGKLTSYIGTLNVGDSLEFKGPKSKFKYITNAYEEIGLIAGGTGIAPMLQIIRKIFKNPSDHTRMSLIFANRFEHDIILKSEFDGYARDYPNQFRVQNVLSQAPNGWSGYSGHINKDILEKHLPRPETNTIIFVSGTDSFVKSIAGKKSKKGRETSGMLPELGYNPNEIHRF